MELKNLLGYKEFVEKDVRKFDVKQSQRSISSKDVLASDVKGNTEEETKDLDINDLKDTFKSKKTDITETGKDATAIIEKKENCDTDGECKENPKCDTDGECKDTKKCKCGKDDCEGCDKCKDEEKE